MTDKKGSIRGEWVSGPRHINVNLPMIVFEEDGCNIVFCPALDVSGYGKSEDEAMHSFTHCLGEFFQYTTNKRTFHNELIRMGWKIKNTKIQKMIPPPMSKLLETNDNFSRIFNDHSFRKIDRSVEMPVSC